MKLVFNLDEQASKCECKMIRENKDKRIYSDSALFVLLRNELNRRGYDVIKKLAWKDGNLVSVDQYWVRTRNFSQKNPNAFAIHWNHHAIRPAYQDYNRGEVELSFAY